VSERSGQLPAFVEFIALLNIGRMKRIPTQGLECFFLKLSVLDRSLSSFFYQSRRDIGTPSCSARPSASDNGIAECGLPLANGISTPKCHTGAVQLNKAGPPDPDYNQSFASGCQLFTSSRRDLRRMTMLSFPNHRLFATRRRFFRDSCVCSLLSSPVTCGAVYNFLAPPLRLIYER
jgi:hypothetical protein